MAGTPVVLKSGLKLGTNQVFIQACSVLRNVIIARLISLEDFGTNLFITLLALPLAFSLRNYSVMLWLLLLQGVSSMVGSHLLAERPYRWAWDRNYLKRVFAFGWPLLVNGLLMFLIFQGDRF